MFKKGISGNNSGRPKGAKGKAPQEVKQVIEQVIAEMFTPEQIAVDLLKCEPRERLNILLKLCEFTIPKLKSVDATIEKDNSRPFFIFKDISGQIVEPDSIIVHSDQAIHDLMKL